MYLIFDTETTGLPTKDFKARIVELAALVVDQNKVVHHKINTLIKPDGWTIPDEAFAIHGKTLEMCEEQGRPMKQVLEEFNHLKSLCHTRVAHNLWFDKRMIAIEEGIYGIPHDSSGLESFCTMQKSKSIVKMPPTDAMIIAGFNTYKTPSLQETYTHFFGKPFDNDHNALADGLACMEVFFKLKEIL